MLLNCGVGENSWESPGLQGDPTSPFWRRSTLGFLWKEEGETPVPWPPHPKSWLIGEDSDAGREWGQEEKGTTEDEMAGWHHWLEGHESEWTPGVGAGEGGLACCNSWGCKESDTTERLNWTELNWMNDQNPYFQRNSFSFYHCKDGCIIPEEQDGENLKQVCKLCLKWKSKLLSLVRLFAASWTVVRGILQAGILKWVAFLFSRESSQPRDRTQVSCTAGGFFTTWATGEVKALHFNHKYLTCIWLHKI